MDRMTMEQRSRNMSRIRMRDTGPELALRKALLANGIRGYRVSPRGITGSPDIAFIGKKTAVFVDGCFWHRCPDCYREPSTNSLFWKMKTERNKERDIKVNALLREQGWSVVRIWEHEIRADPYLATTAVISALHGSCHH